MAFNSQADFFLVATLDDYSKACKKLKGCGRLAIDTETYVLPEWENKRGSALDPHTGRISLLIAKPDNLPPFIFDLFLLTELNYSPLELVDTLRSVEQKGFLVGVNFKFDLQFMYTTLNYLPESVRCIRIMSKLVSNATGSKVGRSHGHSYADICRELLNVHLTGKKDLRVSTWSIGSEGRTLSSPWWAEKLNYAAKDTEYVLQCHDLLEPMICRPLPKTPLIVNGTTSQDYGLGMQEVFCREMELIPLIAEIELHGMPVSLETMRLYQEGVREAMEDVAVYLSVELGLDTPQLNWEGREVPSTKALRVLRSSTGLLTVIQKAIKLNKISDVQAATLKRMLEILDQLYSLKSSDLGGDGEKGVEDIFLSEDEAFLYEELVTMEESFLQTITPVIKAIVDFKRLQKQDGMNLESYVNPVTGRIHPKYDQLGAATSRMSSSSPNSQQIGNKSHATLTLNKLWFLPVQLKADWF